jgi:ornithine decarboxylase
MVVAHAGTGFDCASPAEIDVVLSLGVPPERIIYAHPVKSPAQVPPSAHTLSPTML